MSRGDALSLLSSINFAETSKFCSLLFNGVSSLITSLSNDNLPPTDKSTPQKIQVFGFNCLDGTQFKFSRHISCSGNAEQWIPSLFDASKYSFQKLISDALTSFPKSQNPELDSTIPNISQLDCIDDNLYK